MGLFESFHGGTQAGNGMFEGVGIFVLTRGFEGGKLGEPGDAVGLFAMGLLQTADLGLQPAEEAEQFLFFVFAHGRGAADLGFQLTNGFFDHRLS